MKFVIRSLLFVNLLLQMTGSLRKCFNQDQNLMLTIVLLAFSLIGIVGLTIGNRFILVVFAACMTLILIASITIYAIGRTEQDSIKPKVPYYTSSKEASQDSLTNLDDNHSSLKSFVNKLLNKTEQRKTKANRNKTNRTRGSENARLKSKQHQKKLSYPSASSPPLPAILDDYSDSEAASVVNLLLSSPTNSQVMPTSGSGLSAIKSNDLVELAKERNKNLGSGSDMDPSDLLQDDTNLVRSQQWIDYERYLYVRYLDIVSQSIDLVLLTILASWMALLLDEETDHCFGNKGTSRKVRSLDLNKEIPMYNYNGVRYSIKPDDFESPGRVVIR